jgi:adenylate cyclase
MKWQPAFAYKVRQVLIITFSWVVIGVFVELSNAINYDPDTGKHFIHFIFGNSAIEHLLITAIGPLLGGLIAGSFIVFYQREKLIRKTYRQQLFIHSLFYILFVFFCILIVLYIGALIDEKKTFLEKFYNDLFSLRLIRLLFIWYFIVILTIFILDVSEKYGSGTLRKLLLGKYHSPGKEDRIFMFLDLKSSTSIAEQIGDDTYFRMIRYFYNIVNDVTINNYGEIYQYVGDEIVISWTKESEG